MDVQHGLSKDKLGGHTEGPFEVIRRTARKLVIQPEKGVGQVNSGR